MNSSNSMQSLSLDRDQIRRIPLQERCRGGSLPLKKRRFTVSENPRAMFKPLPWSSRCRANLSSAHQHSDTSLVRRSAPLKKRGIDGVTAALPLAVAREGHSAGAVPHGAESRAPPIVEHHDNAKTKDFVDDDSASWETDHSASPSGDIVVSKSCSGGNGNGSGGHQAQRRSHRPPLTSPLPGGCHGRTSRNNSYCRRQPCYKGSKYCKLHYQHYVVAGIRTPLDDSTGGHCQDSVAASSATTCRPVEVASTETSPKNSNPQLHSAAAATSHHQDKRFTGCGDERRCQATTTRGRACAYVSVKGTKYCYLHADYDTNPPPRRGGCGGGNHKTKTKKAGEAVSSAPQASSGKENLSTTPDSLPSVSSSGEASLCSPVSVALDDMGSSSLSREATVPEKTTMALKERSHNGGGSKSSKTSRRAMSSKLAEKHADSPFPLLSMISTDQWYHRKVAISTGPLTNRVGIVEKWGNGWVSVAVPGIGLHNRRSFELYLHSTTAGEDGEVAFASNSRQHSSSLQDSHEDSSSSSSLFRCVSREAVSPSPTILLAPSGSEQGTEATIGSWSFSDPHGSRPPSCAPMRVPTTPRPSYEEGEVSYVGRAWEGNSFTDTPNPTRAERQEELRRGLLPKVTPVSPQKARADVKVPMVDSLLLASTHDGTANNKKYHLNMLFRTASLERSRRGLQTSAHHEETGMPKKRSNKCRKGRKTSLEGSEGDHQELVPNKKARLDYVPEVEASSTRSDYQRCSLND